MKNVTVVFPGQGSQYVGMGNKSDLEKWFDKSVTTLGYDLKNLSFNGPEEELKLTQNTQPAIVTHSIALFEKLSHFLADKKVTIDKVLGHSVGEYAALVAAGSLAFEDAVKAVHLRGKFMQEAVKVGEGKMYAILRAPEQLVNEVCKQVSTSDCMVMPANYNEPSQIVISGHAKACDEAVKIFETNEEHRIRCVELPVSAPFHCLLMKPAADILSSHLDTITFNKLNIPYIANIDAKEYDIDTDPNKIRSNLVEQVCGSVLWTQSFENFSDDSIIIECGPGQVLKGLLRRINKNFKVIAMDSDAAIDELSKVLNND